MFYVALNNPIESVRELNLAFEVGLVGKFTRYMPRARGYCRYSVSLSAVLQPLTTKGHSSQYSIKNASYDFGGTNSSTHFLFYFQFTKTVIYKYQQLTECGYRAKTEN